MNKPVSIFICGVQKGGTTSLHAHFSEHPGLSAPNVKEPHVFDDETANWSRPDYSRLDAHFDPADGDRPRFEATPVYSFWPPAIPRIRAYNPDAKLIFLFRDPFERAWSHWSMEYSRREDTLPFAAAIREGRARLEGLPLLSPAWRIFSYVERGLYGHQVRRALAHFPRAQLLFLRSEDLGTNHTATLRRVAAFLGIAPFPDTGPKQEHRGPTVDPSLSATEADRALIADLVREDMRVFMDLTSLDISAWPVMRGAPALAAPVGSPAPPPRPSEPVARVRPAVRRPPNVLFIGVDDLNSWIGALGRQPDVRTPAIDALARRGTLFSHAYCPAPYCNASRMSVFTGCLPSTTGIYNNEPFWDAPDRRQTFFESFQQAGYHTFGAGKVFHGTYDYARAVETRSTSVNWRPVENRTQLWNRFENSPPEQLPPGMPLSRMFDFNRLASVPPMYHDFDWGVLPDSQASQMPDEIVCRSVEDFLTRRHPEPFLCAAGIYKPHLPWHVPKRFMDLYDPEKLTLPLVRADDLDDVPPLARQWAMWPPDHELVTSRGQWRNAVQGYLAAISYCDWIVGRIVDALDRSGLAENTVTVLWSDNGFHLGEKLHWRKFALWEEATRVPLIIVPPRDRPCLPRVYQPVSLVDLFPTIAELCDVGGPGDIDGSSLVEAMTDDSWEGSPAIMTWGRGNHSVRTGDWRYTRYHDGGQELYDLRADPNEWTNLADDARFAAYVETLGGLLPDARA